MILTYHQAIELMSYLPMALPVIQPATDDKSGSAHLPQHVSDLQTLILNAGSETDMDELELLYAKTA